MKLKNKRRFIILTIIVFFILIIGDRYIGIKGVANLYPTYTYSWEDIGSNILFYLCWVLFISIPVNYIFDWAKDANIKSLENAKKRIEEKERKENEKKLETENEDNDKTEI